MISIPVGYAAMLVVFIISGLLALRVSPGTLERLGCWMIACAVANRKRREIRQDTYQELTRERGIAVPEKIFLERSASDD